MKTKELTEDRAKLAKQIQELAKDEANWDAEKRSQWDSLNTQYDDLTEQIEAEEQRIKHRARLDEIAEQQNRESHGTSTEIGEERQERSGVPTDEQRALAFQAILRTHSCRELKPEHRKALEICKVTPQAEFEAIWQPYSYRMGAGMWSTANGSGRMKRDLESRAGLNKGTAAEGGYTVPEGFMAELENTLLAWGGLRQVARIISTASGNDMPWPVVDDTGNTGELLAEATSMGTSVDATYSVVTLKAYKYSSKPCLVSAELLEDSAFNLAAELGSQLGVRIGRITSTHYATGDNSAKPQGIIAASAGVTAASTTTFTADELISLQDSLDPAYEMLPSVGWVMNKAARTVARKLKDSNGAYIWQPSFQAGVPDLLLGKPIAIVQEMPALTTGLKPIVYGALEKYIIRDVASARFYRLEELYRATDQTGFVMFARHDGRLLNSGALKRLTLA